MQATNVPHHQSLESRSLTKLSSTDIAYSCSQAETQSADIDARRSNKVDRSGKYAAQGRNYRLGHRPEALAAKCDTCRLKSGKCKPSEEPSSERWTCRRCSNAGPSTACVFSEDTRHSLSYCALLGKGWRYLPTGEDLACIGVVLQHDSSSLKRKADTPDSSTDRPSCRTRITSSLDAEDDGDELVVLWAGPAGTGPQLWSPRRSSRQMTGCGLAAPAVDVVEIESGGSPSIQEGVL